MQAIRSWHGQKCQCLQRDGKWMADNGLGDKDCGELTTESFRLQNILESLEMRGFMITTEPIVEENREQTTCDDEMFTICLWMSSTDKESRELIGQYGSSMLRMRNGTMCQDYPGGS